MSGDALGALRREITAALTDAGVKAFDTWPVRAVPYSAVVIPGLPYITPGSPGEVSFGEVIVFHRVVLIAGRATVAVQTEMLGDLLLQCLSALAGKWDEVSDPSVVDVAGLGEVLAYEITVPTRFRIPASTGGP